MAWIKTIPFHEADEALRRALEAQHALYPKEYERTAGRREREHRGDPHPHPRGPPPRLRDLRGAHVARRCRSPGRSTR